MKCVLLKVVIYYSRFSFVGYTRHYKYTIDVLKDNYDKSFSHLESILDNINRSSYRIHDIYCEIIGQITPTYTNRIDDIMKLMERYY